MPAEWEPHAATWIAWPHNPNDWPGRFQPIPWVYAEIIRRLARGERVNILVNDRALRAKATKVLTDSGVLLENVRFYLWPTDRIWTRDSGAIFLRKGKPGRAELAATEWRFNAWAKYKDWARDVKIAARIARESGAICWKPVVEVAGKQRHLVLEGGSIDVNGRGTLLTTEECLLSEVQQRNPGVTREQMEKAFADYLGCSHTIWLKRGIAGDDTHGHVDDVARFVSKDTVLTVSEVHTSDDNYIPLQQTLEVLRTAKDQDGKRLKVITIPMPRPLVFKGQRLPASYANFYIANSAVLVPTFDDPNDRIALNTIAELFPKRDIVPIHCGDFIWGLGAIHCMTQQQPAV